MDSYLVLDVNRYSTNLENLMLITWFYEKYNFWEINYLHHVEFGDVYTLAKD